MEKILVIITCITPFAFGYLLKLLKQDPLHPTSIILYFWGVLLLSSMLFLWEVEFSLFTIFYLFVAFASYSIGAFVLPGMGKKYKRNNVSINLLAVKKSCVIFPLISIISSLFVIADSGVDLTKFLTGFSGVAGEFATMRGTTGVSYGIFGILSVGSGYFSSWCAGLLFSLQRKSGKYVFFASAPIFFIMLTQSAKLILFVGFSMFVSGLVIGRIFGGSLLFQYFNIKGFKNMAIIIVLVGIAIGFSFTTREGYGDYADILELVAMLKYLLSSYLLGPLYAFNDFFKFTIGLPSDSNYLNDYNSGGIYTFYSIFSLLGYYKDFPMGTYAETGFSPGIYETNIFTAFRGLVYDFGIFGSIIFMFIIGLLFNIFYFFAKKNHNSFAIGIVSISIPFGFIIYLISPFMANYLFLQAFMITVFVNKFKIYRSI